MALGLVGATVVPAAAAPVATIDIADATRSSQDQFVYEIPPVAPDVDTIELTLPAFALDLTVAGGEAYAYVGDASTSDPLNISGGVVTLDISSLALVAGSTIEIYITLWDGADYSSSETTRQIFVYSTIGSTNGSQSVLAVSLAALDTTYSYESEYYEFNAENIVVTPGDTVIVEGPAGYFRDGPEGDWDPALSLSFSAAVGFGFGSPSTADVSVDGATLTITVPRPHWAFEQGTPVSLFGSVEQTYFDELDQFIGYDLIDIGLAVTYAPAAAPTVDRVQGADRFVVAQNIARESYPTGTDVIYITNGLNYPDALSAAPAAAFAGGPLLLTLPFALPAGLAQTITDLAPEEIIVVGGENSVNPSVYAELSALVGGNISRLGGADRFAASRNLTVDAFGTAGAPVVYLATGLNFPDALSASAAAGAIGAPVILVNGTLPSLDTATLQLLETLGTEFVYIAGGPNSVSNGILSSLDTEGYGVERLSGSDRFEASSNIARTGFPTAERVFIATGFNFPDALAGAAWAGSIGAPLIVIPGTCIPARVLQDLENYQVSEVTILGGPNSVSTAVESLTPCAGFAWPAQAPALGSADSATPGALERIERLAERLTADQ